MRPGDVYFASIHLAIVLSRHFHHLSVVCISLLLLRAVGVAGKPAMPGSRSRMGCPRRGRGYPLSEPCPAHGLAQTLRHQPGPSRTHPQSVTPTRFSTESFLQIILVVYGALIFASLPLSPGKTGPSPSPALPPLCLRISPRQPIVLQCHSDAECGSPHPPGLASLT